MSADEQEQGGLSAGPGAEGSPASPNHAVAVSAIVRAKAIAAAGGRDWVEQLAGTVSALERAWSITVTDPIPGGTASFVARAVTDDSGRDVVMKVAVPGTGLAQQVRTLLAADGDGYVRVLAHDSDHEAVLLEALGSSLHDSALGPVDQLSVLARLLRRAWRVPPPAGGPGPVDKAASLGELITQLWEDLGHPCDRGVVEHALACARRRSAAFDPGTCVVVHGDAAAANAARVLDPRAGTEDGFVLLDPDGFTGDRAYDLGVALRDWCSELLATSTPAALLTDYCQALAAEAGVDATEIRDGPTSSGSPPASTPSLSAPTTTPALSCKPPRRSSPGDR